MSTQHPGLLTRVVVVRVHPEGPSRLVAQLADAARSDRADRGSNPREPTIPAWRNRWDHAEGDIVEWQDNRVVGAEVRVRLPLSSPGWARRSTPGPPSKSCCGGKGRRPWRSHKPRHAGSIPASATTAGSFNGRTAVLHAAHGGSIPSPATSFNGGRKTTASRGGCVPPSAGSIPAAHPIAIPRVVG